MLRLLCRCIPRLFLLRLSCSWCTREIQHPKAVLTSRVMQTMYKGNPTSQGSSYLTCYADNVQGKSNIPRQFLPRLLCRQCTREIQQARLSLISHDAGDVPRKYNVQRRGRHCSGWHLVSDGLFLHLLTGEGKIPRASPDLSPPLAILVSGARCLHWVLDRNQHQQHHGVVAVNSFSNDVSSGGWVECSNIRRFSNVTSLLRKWWALEGKSAVKLQR